MKEKLKSILLVDDDENCNFFHKRLLKKLDIVENIYEAMDGEEAIKFLSSDIDGQPPNPSIIFLDINMPVMDGWSFLEEYQKLEEGRKAQIVLIMLTTSLNPDDKERAHKHGSVNGFLNKYLSKEDIERIMQEHFPT